MRTTKVQNSLHILCSDPESFFRGGPTLTTFFVLVDDGREDPNTTIRLKGCFTGGPMIKCWLGSFVALQGIRTSIAKKPNLFVIFQGGPDPLSPLLGPPMAYTQAYQCLCYLHLLSWKYTLVVKLAPCQIVMLHLASVVEQAGLSLTWSETL